MSTFGDFVLYEEIFEELLEQLDFRALQKTIKENPPLSADEERRAFEELKSKDPRKRKLAIDKLVKANIRIAIKEIVKYSKFLGGDYSEIFSFVLEKGLLQAIKNFDIKRNIRFNTFATSYCKGRSSDFIRKEQKKRGKEVGAEEVAHKIDQWSASKTSPEEAILTSVTVRKLLKKLPERERKILQYRYLEGFTLDEISKKLKISIAWVERLEKLALSKLRPKR